MNKFNHFQIYSKVGKSENSIKELDINSMLDEFKSIKTIEKAKEFLKDSLGIEKEVNNYFLEKDCWLSVAEHNEFFEVNFSLRRRDVRYCYGK